jgi:hypothetical protein
MITSLVPCNDFLVLYIRICFYDANQLDFSKRHPTNSALAMFFQRKNSLIQDLPVKAGRLVKTLRTCLRFNFGSIPVYRLLLNSFCDVFRKKNSPIPRKGYREIQESPVKPAALKNCYALACNFSAVQILYENWSAKFFQRKNSPIVRRTIERYRICRSSRPPC